MTSFLELPVDQQLSLENRFFLPENKAQIFIDEHNRPFEQLTSSARMFYSIKSTFDNFHNYSRKQNLTKF